MRWGGPKCLMGAKFYYIFKEKSLVLSARVYSENRTVLKQMRILMLFERKLYSKKSNVLLLSLCLMYVSRKWDRIEASKQNETFSHFHTDPK